MTISKFKLNTGSIRRYFEAEENEKKRKAIEESMRQDELNESISTSLTRGILRKNAKRRHLTNLNSHAKLLRETFVVDVLFESYFNAIPIDSVAKEDARPAIKAFFRKSLNEAGGVEYLDSIKESNRYLTKVMTECIDIMVNEIIVSNSKLQENTKSEVVIDDETKKNLDKAKESLDIEEIADVVKEKVIEVIKRETDAYKAEEEKIEELKTDLEDNYEDEADEKLAERFEASLKSRKLLREETLYSSTLLKYKTLAESECEEVNLDMVMGDSIIEYTLHETFNTLGIIKYDNRHIREVIDKNKHTK